MVRSTTTYLVILILALLVVCFAAVPALAEDSANAAPPAVNSAQDSHPTGMDVPAQPAPTKEKRRLVLMPSFNSFSPSDSKTQSRFGSTWRGIGLAVAYKTKNMDPRKIEFRLDGIAERSNLTSAYVFPIGFGVNKILSSSESVTTYAGLTANLYVAKLKSVQDNVDTGWQFRAGAGALVGANLGKRVNVQACYYLIPELGGFNLSGFNVSAHLQIWTF